MIDESNNYQLGLDFFYRQNSDNFSYFRKHFLKQMTDESTQTDFSSYHHHIIIIKNGEDSSLICGFTALWRLGFFILSSSHYHHPDLWLHRPLMAQKMVRIFARFVASPPAEGSKNGEDSSLICGFTARWRLGFFILSSTKLVQKICSWNWNLQKITHRLDFCQTTNKQ